MMAKVRRRAASSGRVSFDMFVPLGGAT